MKIRAYGVHAFTATGAALGLWSIILIFEGYFQEAIWVLCGAAIVDSVDGALARAVDIHDNAPRIDGALMDNIIDFVTWTIGPLVWIYATMQIPVWVLMLCAFASIFGFTNIEAKTEDNFFSGFPSFWNIVVLYIYLLDVAGVWASVILLGFAVTTFLPVKFIYPSKTKFLMPVTLALGALFTLQLISIIILFDNSPLWLIYSSFIFPVYYFAISFYLQLKHL